MPNSYCEVKTRSSQPMLMRSEPTWGLRSSWAATEIRDYWSTNEYLRYAPIAERISRDRFEEITRYLHFVDNEFLPARGEEGFYRLQKVEPVISALKVNFRAAYSPHCQVSVDEAMIPFKGRSTMKQYLPLKPVKRGLKVWALADSLNGYLCDFNVYWR